MAEAAEVMDRLFLFAADVAAGAAPLKQVTPLSPNVKAIGSVLGLAVAAVGVWLARAHRAQLGKPVEEQGLSAKLRWRTPIALLLAASGLLVEAGVWTDPTKAPGAFVVIWLLAMVLLTVTIIAAGVDWWWVTRLATLERQALIRHDRDRLFVDLASRKRPPASPNGRPPSSDV